MHRPELSTPRPALLRAGIAVAATAATALLAACGGGASGNATANATSAPASTASSASAAATSGATVATAQTNLGTILVGPNGHTLYALVSPSGSPLPCAGGCLSTWPPLTVTSGSPSAGSGVSATLTTGARGQVEAGGLPLYFFAGDGGAGQTNGEGIPATGGTWYALDGSGHPVKGAGAAATSGGY